MKNRLFTPRSQLVIVVLALFFACEDHRIPVDLPESAWPQMDLHGPIPANSSLTGSRFWLRMVAQLPKLRQPVLLPY
jgi:hypothetical protein